MKVVGMPLPLDKKVPWSFTLFSAETKTKNILPLLIPLSFLNAQSDVVVFIPCLTPQVPFGLISDLTTQPTPQLFEACLKPRPPTSASSAPSEERRLTPEKLISLRYKELFQRLAPQGKKNGHMIKQFTGGEIYICNRHMKMYSTSIIKEIPILNIFIYQTGSFVKDHHLLEKQGYHFSSLPAPWTNPPWGQVFQTKGASLHRTPSSGNSVAGKTRRAPSD